MVTTGRLCKCKKCGKTIQYIRIGTRYVPVNPGMIHFSRCDMALSSFIDIHGREVKGYRMEKDGEMGWQPHDATTNCFVFPWEANGKGNREHAETGNLRSV